MLRGAGRDRHEALAKRKLLGFAAAGGANSQFASKTVPPPPPEGRPRAVTARRRDPAGPCTASRVRILSAAAQGPGWAPAHPSAWT